MVSGHSIDRLGRGPYISIVIAARNDDYGGDFNKRLSLFVGHLQHSFHRPLFAELVVVNWNPPADRPPLSAAIKWPVGSEIPIRIVTVPAEIHAGLDGSDKTTMFEYRAKNVGIRRARGTFILVTNPDVLFSTELVRELSQRHLKHDAFYRVDRFDYRGLPITARRRAALLYARMRTYRVNFRHRPAEPEIVQTCVADLTARQRLAGLILNRWPGSHETAPELTTELDIAINDETQFYGGIYSNAAGDFLLTSAENWGKIHGFPEYTDISTHLDGYACSQFKALGLEQRLLRTPCMIFHADHKREERKSRPLERDWEEEQRAIRAGQLKVRLNDESWGLGDISLREEPVAVGREKSIA